MRDEYDFSKAKPNRYAERLAGGPISTPTTRGEQPPTGVVEVLKDNHGQYRWRLKADNGELLAMSAQSFATRDACHKAVDAFIQAMAHPTRTEVGAA